MIKGICSTCSPSMPWKISSPVSTVPRITHSSWMRPSNSSILLLMFLASVQKYLNCFCLVLSELSVEEVPSVCWLEGLPDAGFWQGKCSPVLCCSLLFLSWLLCSYRHGHPPALCVFQAGCNQGQERKHSLRHSLDPSTGSITTYLSSS